MHGAEPAHTPEQLVAATEAARKALLEFTSREQLAWPHYYDGRYWENPIAKQHSVNQLPAMLLLDPAGNLVRSDVRAEDLERAVRQLLNL